MADNKENKKNFKFFSFGSSAYEIPQMKVKRKRNVQYVSFGEDNDYPRFLEGLLNNAEHNAIINSKVDYIAGEGFNMDALSESQKQWFIDNDMESFIQKIARDYEIYGGFCFYVVKTRDGEGIAKLEYEDFAKVRINSDENAFLVVENSEDWSKYRCDTIEVQPYTEDTEESKTLYYFKGNLSKEIYPLPKYYGAIKSIQTGIEIDNFHLNHVKNGFFIPTIFQFNGPIPNEEEQELLERDLENKFSGTDKAGKFFMLFNEGDETGVEIQTMEPAELDKKFEVLAEQIQQKVLSGHRVTSPMLFGIRQEGQLGGRTELIEAYELFKRTYVKPTQNTLESVLTEILSKNFDEIDIELLERVPIESQISEERLYQNMTRAEIRQQAGLEDSEITEQESMIMKLYDLPEPMLKAFIDKLSDEELFNLIGYERNIPNDTTIQNNK